MSVPVEYIQVQTTLPTEEEARRVATSLVERRLAACVQCVAPIQSVYWWDGQVETSQEWLCLLKTRASLFSEVERCLREVHPYECPQIVATPLVETSDDYRRWLEASTDRKAGEPKQEDLKPGDD